MFISLSSCTALKNVVQEKEHISKNTKNSQSVVDSIVSVFKNREIADQFSFKIPRSNTNNKSKDSILDARLDEILAKINFKKRSGFNSYKMRYNPKEREIQTNITVGATKDSINNVTKSATEVTKESSSIATYIKKTGIPTKWLLIAGLIYFRKDIFWLIQKIIKLIKPL